MELTACETPRMLMDMKAHTCVLVGNGSGGGVGPLGDQEMMISSFGAGGGTTSVPGTGTNSLHVMPLPPSKPKPHLPFSDHILNG